MKIIRKCIVAGVFVSFLLLGAESQAAYSYTIIGSNKGDSGGPAVGEVVSVYLAAPNTDPGCNPYAGSANCAADCSASPSDCTEVGQLLVGADNVVLSPTPSFAQSSASVWIGYSGRYFQCTPAVASTCADTITAHMGGCLGQS